MIEKKVFDLIENIAPTSPILHQKIYPSITYNVISASEQYNHDGNSNVKQLIIQISTWGKTYAEAKDTQDLVFATLDAYKNQEITGIFLETTVDLYDGETEVYQCASDYRVNYREV